MNNKIFLQKLYKLAIPIALQNFLMCSLTFVDNIMIARLGEHTLATVTIANQYFFIFYLTQMGITSGASIFIAQFWGIKEIKNIQKVLTITLICMILLSILFLVPTFTCGNLIFNVFSNDFSIAKKGIVFLRLTAVSNVFMSISMTFTSVQKSMGNVKFPLIISFISLGINTVLNYMLINGLSFFPKMGLKGACIATLISRLIEILSIIIFLLNDKNSINIKFKFNIGMEFLKKFFKTTLPVIFNEIVWSLGISTYYVVYGRLGTEAIASLSVTFLLERFFFVFAIGTAGACEIMLGKKLGEGNKSEAYKISKQFLKMIILIGIIIIILVMCISKQMILLLNLSYSVNQLAFRNILVFILIVLFRCINLIGICGILRSGGDTRYAFFVDVLVLWFVGIPIAFLTGIIMNLPVYIVYLCISSEEVIKSFFVCKRIKSKKWMNNLNQL